MQGYSKQTYEWELVERTAQMVANLPTGNGVPPTRGVSKRFRIEQRLDAETVAAMVAEYQAGAPSTQLMESYGLGKGTVLQVLRDAGVKLRKQPLSPAAIDQAVRWYAEGWSLARIGRELGCDGETVRQRLLERGVEIRRRRGWDYKA